MSSQLVPSFAVRSSSGIEIRNGVPNFNENAAFKAEKIKGCRTMVFSPDGKYFAWTIAGISIKIASVVDWKVVKEIPQPRCSEIAFSPKSTYLMTWEVFVVNKENPTGAPNLHIYKSETWELVKKFTHKKQQNWELQWMQDEKICARMVNNDVVFYEDANFERIVHRINCAKISAYSLSTGMALHVLCYIPGATNQPAAGKLFKYPQFEAQNSLAHKTFFQVDKVDFYWNNKGNSALLMTTTDVDKTGASYYGKQTLHYMATNGTSALVSFSKEGPIYSVAWSPKSTEFCAVYGFMPAKATIFNLKCESVFDLGTAPRNVAHYNPQGNILLLAGFGNLRGQIELWDTQNKKLINDCEAPDTTLLRWCPDGIHFVTATTAPRLRIGNGYKIWHYSGTLLHERSCNKQEELYDVQWQKYPVGVFKDPVIKYERVEGGIATSQPQASKQVYRPPCARGRPGFTFNLRDDDDEQQPGKGTANMSKAALKQKKKREAKKAKKQENVAPQTIEAEEKVATSSSSAVPITDKDKKIKNLKRKLEAISKLKEQQAAGKPLEINQIAKINSENELLKELKILQI